MARKCDTKEKIRKNAEIAQLVEHNLAKVGVASSSLVFRSLVKTAFSCLFLLLFVGIAQLELAQRKILRDFVFTHIILPI